MPKVSDTKENFEKCICGNCPTWLMVACPKENMEKLYCAKGKSVCNLSEQGCICMTCPVHAENQLSGGYFCTRGAAD